MLHASGASHPGPVRATNEDCVLVNEDLSLFVVADGMGGHAAGEVASRVAIEVVENFVRRSADTHDVSWPCGIDAALTFDGNRLRTAIYLANRRVYRLAESRDEYTGMGTTIVCALVSGGRVTFGHVGDSRLYLLRDRTLMMQTRDDTWAASVLAGSGAEVDARALAEHPMKHVLTNALGAREDAEIHIGAGDFGAGDVLLLCSDGLHGVLDDHVLTGLLVQDVSADALVAAAIERKTRDNVTAVIVRCASEPG
jgi:protein phosphatase